MSLEGLMEHEKEFIEQHPFLRVKVGARNFLKDEDLTQEAVEAYRNDINSLFDFTFRRDFPDVY
jgi:hypothetical protein